MSVKRACSFARGSFIIYIFILYHTGFNESTQDFTRSHIAGALGERILRRSEAFERIFNQWRWRFW